ncbi:MAG: GNAT family N-acetyltransferase [Anaerolineae bacterium]|nr:GNAT family N-acetyltransferase [Anaerolineae bacterium]
MKVLSLTTSVLPFVVQIHRAAFPDSALTKLGAEAVRRYYLWLMTGPHDAVNVGAFDDQDNLVGFCFGGKFRGALSGFLQQNRGFLIRTVLMRPWLLGNEIFRERLSLAFNIFRRLRKKSRSTTAVKKEVSQPKRNSFGILSIAVDPQRQKTGAGRAIMEYCEQIAIQQGFQFMDLTVHPTNHNAVAFYERLGWERVLEQGEWKGRMTKSLVR